MASEEETAHAMKDHLDHCEILIDPHTAVGRVVAHKLRSKGALSGPVITLATAHPAKFPESVERATDQAPKLPSALGDLFEKKEQIVRCQNDPGTVRRVILDNYK